MQALVMQLLALHAVVKEEQEEVVEVVVGVAMEGSMTLSVWSGVSTTTHKGLSLTSR